MYETKKTTNKGIGYHEVRKTTWIFWKSHVSEPCEKWVQSAGNYAYTRFEEFSICSGEVLFTNEHKAVFSKNEKLRYIDINDFKIFKEHSKDSDTVFKIKPVSVKFIKMITAKKDKDVDDNYLKKIKEYLGRIETRFVYYVAVYLKYKKMNLK